MIIKASPSSPRSASCCETCSTASTDHPRPQEATRPQWYFWAACMLYTCLWWISSIAVIVILKSTTSPQGIFPHSFAFTALVQPTTGFVAWLLAKIVHKKSPSPPLQRREWVQVIVLGLIQGIEIGLTNKALTYLSVASRTMTNTMSVLFMMITAWIWGLNTLSWRRGISCAVFVAGGYLQSCDHVSAPLAAKRVHMIGICMQLASMLCRSQRWALAQFMMQCSPPESGLGQTAKLQLLAKTLPIAGLICIPSVFVFEPSAFRSDQLLQAELPARVLLVAVGLTGMLWSEFSLVKQLSAVTFNVLSTVHQIPIILVGVVFQHNHVGEMAISGFALCLIAAFVYAWAMKVEFEARNKLPLIDRE